MTVRLNQPDNPPTLAWYEQLARIVNAGVSSGTTAQRPTAFLFPGRMYFDTSLGSSGKGKPIWRNSDNTAWVDSSGANA